jgi:hypothetical protein
MLVDTDVLVWYLRGNERARTAIEQLQGFSVSVVTYIELLQGMRNKRELTALRRAMRQWPAVVRHLDPEISARAAWYVEQRFLSHALQLADALQAATATVHRLPLLTANARHYSAVTELQTGAFRP